MSQLDDKHERTRRFVKSELFRQIRASVVVSLYTDPPPTYYSTYVLVLIHRRLGNLQPPTGNYLRRTNQKRNGGG